MNQKCLHCDGILEEVLNLGAQPLANKLKNSEFQQEIYYPLIFTRCEKCYLFQTLDFNYDCFTNDYPYFSGFSKAFKNASKKLAQNLLSQYVPKSVLEIASNDGTMLKNFKEIDHIGYEPANLPFLESLKEGLNVRNVPFTYSGDKFDLIIAQNVLAHTPRLNKMVEDIEKSLSLGGRIVIECQDASALLSKGHYYNVYHEHYSYFDRFTLFNVFKSVGLFPEKIESLSAHGGSMRAIFSRKDHGLGYDKLRPNLFEFRQYVFSKRQELIAKLQFKSLDFKIIAEHAPAKLAVLCNYCGIDKDLIIAAIDDNPYKQDHFVSGTRIPIVSRLNAPLYDYTFDCISGLEAKRESLQCTI